MIEKGEKHLEELSEIFNFQEKKVCDKNKTYIKNVETNS